MVMESVIGYESEAFEEDSVLDESEATQAVQVALNIRPLIALEQVQGCKDCIAVVPDEPQVATFLNADFHSRLSYYCSVQLQGQCFRSYSRVCVKVSEKSPFLVFTIIPVFCY